MSDETEGTAVATDTEIAAETMHGDLMLDRLDKIGKQSQGDGELDAAA